MLNSQNNTADSSPKRRLSDKPEFIDPRLFIMTNLMEMHKRVRWAKEEELKFIIVNETKKLVSYEQAFLCDLKEILAISAVSQIDHNSPVVLCLKKIMFYLLNHHDLLETGQLSYDDCKDETVKEFWKNHLAQIIFWQPINGGNHFILLTRNQEFNESDITIIDNISDSYNQRLIHDQTVIKPKFWYKKRILGAFIAC